MLLRGSATARMYDGQGPMWVALHGLMDSSAVWSDPRLPRPLFAPDLPGWGGTPAIASQVEIWIDWLRETVHEYKVQDFYLIGHSLGGGLALAAAEKLRPRGILLVAPLGIGTTRLPGALLRARPLLRHGAHRAMHLPFLTGAVYNTLFSEKKLPADLQNRLQSQSEEIVHGALHAMPVVNELSRRSPVWDGPVEILWGEKDHILRIEENRLRGLPGASVRMLPDCGHDLVREDPSAIQNAAVRLLRQSEPVL